MDEQHLTSPDISKVANALGELGIQFAVVGDRLRVSAPADPGPEILALIKQRKQELIAHFNPHFQFAKSQFASSPSSLETANLANCWHCLGAETCECITCGHYEAEMVWTAGPCQACGARARQEANVQ